MWLGHRPRACRTTSGPVDAGEHPAHLLADLDHREPALGEAGFAAQGVGLGAGADLEDGRAAGGEVVVDDREAGAGDVEAVVAAVDGGERVLGVARSVCSRGTQGGSAMITGNVSSGASASSSRPSRTSTRSAIPAADALARA